MAHPGKAPETSVYPVNIHWTANKGWSITPPSQKVPLDETVRFNTDKNCTVCFEPKNTVFKDKLDLNAGSPFDVQVGSTDFTVDLCATDQGKTCTPVRPIEAMGTIIVGSGLKDDK